MTNIKNKSFVEATQNAKIDQPKHMEINPSTSAASVLACLTVGQSNSMALATEDMQLKMELLHKANNLMLQLKALFANMKAMDSAATQYVKSSGDGKNNSFTSFNGNNQGDHFKNYWLPEYKAGVPDPSCGIGQPQTKGLNFTPDGLTFTYILVTNESTDPDKPNNVEHRVSFTIPNELLALFNIPASASPVDQAKMLLDEIGHGDPLSNCINDDKEVKEINKGREKHETYYTVNAYGITIPHDRVVPDDMQKPPANPAYSDSPYGETGFFQRLTQAIISKISQPIESLGLKIDSGAFNAGSSATLDNAIQSTNEYSDTVIQPQLNQYASKLQQLVQTANQYLGIQQNYQNTTR
jgi:hypothetical protein